MPQAGAAFTHKWRCIGGGIELLFQAMRAARLVALTRAAIHQGKQFHSQFAVDARLNVHFFGCAGADLGIAGVALCDLPQLLQCNRNMFYALRLLLRSQGNFGHQQVGFMHLFFDIEK